jgi:hypothetical protein
MVYGAWIQKTTIFYIQTQCKQRSYYDMKAMILFKLLTTITIGALF